MEPVIDDTYGLFLCFWMDKYATSAFGDHDFEDSYTFLLFCLIWGHVSRERVGSMILGIVIGYSYVSGWTDMQRLCLGSIIFKTVTLFSCFTREWQHALTTRTSCTFFSIRRP